MVPSWSQSHNATREYATATRARFTVGSRSHEFHPTLGPKITYQVPEEYISRELCSRDGQNDSFPGTSSFSSVHYTDSFI